MMTSLALSVKRAPAEVSTGSVLEQTQKSAPAPAKPAQAPPVQVPVQPSQGPVPAPSQQKPAPGATPQK